MPKQTLDKRTKKKQEEEFDKHFKKIADKLAVEVNTIYDSTIIPKYGDILNLHKKH